jgi:hypothetical protein
MHTILSYYTLSALEANYQEIFALNYNLFLNDNQKQKKFYKIQMFEIYLLLSHQEKTDSTEESFLILF